MRIVIHEPELIARRGHNGFYAYFLSALVNHAGAWPTDEARPLPRLTQPREHESAWVQFDGHPVFFDMSDHAQFLDLAALEHCDVYFKANLHRGLARRILMNAELSHLEAKLSPFLFFAEGLERFQRDRQWRHWLRTDRPCQDVCHVAGVYANPVRDGGRSPYEHAEEPLTSTSSHFWIRWHTQQALRNAGITGCYRLTSRTVRTLEDNQTVFSNLSRREFSRQITKGRLTVVNTFPHAIFPWKATESLVLGRPLLIEQAPLTETPAQFALHPGLHFIELLPNSGDFDPRAPLEDPGSYRILTRIPLCRFQEQAGWLRGVLADHDRLAEMGRACLSFASTAYTKPKVADYIVDTVRARIH
ncbi:MAG: hypothetical protein WCO42_03760 [bacterium]